MGVRVKVGLKDSVGVDKIFLRAPLVFMEHRAPLAPMDA